MTAHNDVSFHKVIDNLFIGDRRLAKDKDKLKELGITYVVNATSEIRNYFDVVPFHYFRAPAADTDVANIGQYFDDAVEFIEEGRAQGHGVLVHCQQGVSRSASVVLAYLMKKHGMTLKQGYTKLKEIRNQVKPKPNFLKQLVEYEQKLDARWSIKATSQKYQDTATQEVKDQDKDKDTESDKANGQDKEKSNGVLHPGTSPQAQEEQSGVGSSSDKERGRNGLVVRVDESSSSTSSSKSPSRKKRRKVVGPHMPSSPSFSSTPSSNTGESTSLPRPASETSSSKPSVEKPSSSKGKEKDKDREKDSPKGKGDKRKRCIGPALPPTS